MMKGVTFVVTPFIYIQLNRSGFIFYPKGGQNWRKRATTLPTT